MNRGGRRRLFATRSKPGALGWMSWWALSAAGVLLLTATMLDIFRIVAIQAWPVASGRVLASSVELVPRKELWQPRVTYTYVVSDRSYIGTRVNLTPTVFRRYAQARAYVNLNYVDRYAPHSEIRVYYKNHGDAILDPTISLRTLANAIGSTVLAALALALGVGMARKPRLIWSSTASAVLEA